ncbi:hypothetical protein F2Q68_00040932 [Brassica cretica]|uniref:Uncharacterized protein n=1 Tax=Brassica cretica TaxID=69181 RepID=A0A8S9MNN4_BRACR|nr:hypothetical protein F2Q68_00040932 [Brassica cretica]
MESKLGLIFVFRRNRLVRVQVGDFAGEDAILPLERHVEPLIPKSTNPKTLAGLNHNHPGKKPKPRSRYKPSRSLTCSRPDQPDLSVSSSCSRLAPARSRQTIKAFPIRRSRPDRRDPIPDCSNSIATSASIRSRPDRKQLDPIGVSSRPVRVQLAVHPSWWSGFNKHLG